MAECCMCASLGRLASPYLHSGLKLSAILGFFSFKIIISWSSRRKASRPIWFRKVLSSLAFSGLRSALYLESISPNGSWNEIRTNDTWSLERECAAPWVQVDRKRRNSLFPGEVAVQTCGQRGTARGRWYVLTGICLRPEREENSWIWGPVFIWPCTDSTSFTMEATSALSTDFLPQLWNVSESPLPLQHLRVQQQHAVCMHTSADLCFQNLYIPSTSLHLLSTCSVYTVDWLGNEVFSPPLLFRGCLDSRYHPYSLGGGIPVGSGETMEGTMLISFGRGQTRDLPLKPVRSDHPSSACLGYTHLSACLDPRQLCSETPTWLLWQTELHRRHCRTAVVLWWQWWPHWGGDTKSQKQDRVHSWGMLCTATL